MRDATVDMLRGLAVMAMVWGHVGVSIYDRHGQGRPGITLESAPPLWAEVLGGIAPALFLFVCGMMVAYSFRRGAAASRQWIRMGMLMGVGATIDVLFWRIRPFTTVDVLYCIALVLPLCHLFVARVPSQFRWPMVAAVFALTPLLQSWLGYADYPIEYTLSGKLVMSVENQTSVLNHWIIDGWFPLFPWLGFALLGAALGTRRWDARRSSPRGDLALAGAGAACLVAGLLLGWPDQAARSVLRLNAAGAFMPPDVGYMAASVGALLLLLVACDRLPASRLRAPVQQLGMAPLFLYVAHFPVSWLVARALPTRLALGPTCAVIACTLLGLAALAWGWLRVRGFIADKIAKSSDDASSTDAPLADPVPAD